MGLAPPYRVVTRVGVSGVSSESHLITNGRDPWSKLKSLQSTINFIKQILKFQTAVLIFKFSQHSVAHSAVNVSHNSAAEAAPLPTSSAE